MVRERYWLFCFAGYYPEGGMHDFVGSFSSVEAAQNAAHSDCAQVLDIETMKLVSIGTSQWVNGNPKNIEWDWSIPDYRHGGDYSS